MIAVLSDIHGNLPALEAVLADMPTVQEIWLLGDLLGEMPYPCEVLDRLMALATHTTLRAVLGNREEMLLEIHAGQHDQWRYGTQMRPLIWTVDRLRPEHWAWLKTLTPTCEAMDGTALLFHGTPRVVRGLVHTTEEAAQAASGLPQTRFFGGHSHQAAYYRWTGGQWINPGSVGIALDGIGGVTAYALIGQTPDEPTVAFRTISYPFERTIEAWHESGLCETAPGVTYAQINEMKTGRHHMVKAVAYAREYAKARLGRPVDAIPADLWMEAEQLWIKNHMDQS